MFERLEKNRGEKNRNYCNEIRRKKGKNTKEKLCLQNDWKELHLAERFSFKYEIQ